MSTHALTAVEALARVAELQDERAPLLFEHGSLQVKLYAPRGVDPQMPHARDEAYVILQGRGEFVSADKRRTFAPGDFIFAPAGVAHRFENFTDDFAVWVFFYGPIGGEIPATQ